MAPKGAEPFDVPLHQRIGGQKIQSTADIAAAHLANAPEQIAGVIQHHSRIAAFGDQLRNEIGQAPVALGKGLGVVVIALSGMLRHVLEMGDEGAIGACRHRGLVHVQRAGETRLQRAPIQVAVLKPEGARLMGGRTDCRFLAANGWIEALHVRGRKQAGLLCRSGPGKPSATRRPRHG